MSGSESDPGPGSDFGSGAGSDAGSSAGPAPEQSPHLAYEEVRVDSDKLQSKEFQQIEAQLIADYEAKGFYLKAKTPLADLHRRNDGRAILTFVYTFGPRVDDANLE